GVDCALSRESPVFPAENGTVCSQRSATPDLRLDCHTGFGTASFITGAFGFAAASCVVRLLAETGTESPSPRFSTGATHPLPVQDGETAPNSF
ncbi:MAG: hypothetical protein ACREIC_19480, partial [Limisphaerales bacterium]